MIKNILFIGLALMSLSGFSQQTNPKVTLTGANNQATVYRGAIGANTAMLLPLGTHDAIYPDLPLKGRIQFNDETGKVEVHNGTQWVEIGSGAGGAKFGEQDVFFENDRSVDFNALSMDWKNVLDFNMSGPTNTEYENYNLGNGFTFLYNNGTGMPEWEGYAFLASPKFELCSYFPDTVLVLLYNAQTGWYGVMDFYKTDFSGNIVYSKKVDLTGYEVLGAYLPEKGTVNLFMDLPDMGTASPQENYLVWDPETHQITVKQNEIDGDNGGGGDDGGNGGGETPNLNDVAQVGNWAKTDLYVSQYGESSTDYIRHGYRELEWHTGSISFPGGTSTKIRPQNHVATQDNVIELPAGSGTIPLNVDGATTDMYGNINLTREFSGRANMTFIPYELRTITYYEYMDNVDADWYLPNPNDCLGKTIVILSKGHTIKLHGALFRGINLTELNVTVCTTIKAYANNGSPKWFVINEVKL